MFSKQKYINVISLAVIHIVNSIFLLKFSVNHTDHAVLLLVLYITAVPLILLAAGNTERYSSFLNKKAILSAIILISAGVFIFILLVPRYGEIGRLPAIEDWITRLMNGEFPYNSPHTPSSYPVIFLLALPFFLIGNTGLLVFSGVLLFFIILRAQEDSDKGKLVKILLLLMSVIFYYEVVTRSELFFNMMLAAGTVYICEKYLDASSRDKNFFLIAILNGFVLSTRSVTALLLMIYLLFRFRYDLKNLFIFGIPALLIFISFLIPLYLWDTESFIRNGPFAVQSYLSNIPPVIILIIFLSAIYSGWVITNVQEFFFAGGLILFTAALVSFLLRVNDIGLSESLFNDGYDIAYFIFSVPLLILSIKDYRTDRYLGRVYNFQSKV